MKLSGHHCAARDGPTESFWKVACIWRRKSSLGGVLRARPYSSMWSSHS